MNKYNGEKYSDAVYSEQLSGNPYLDAMPSMLSKNEFMKLISNTIKAPCNLQELNQLERRKLVMDLDKVFVPLDYMYYVYDLLYRAILANYSSKKIIDDVRLLNFHYRNDKSKINNNGFGTESYCGSLLGVPGIGKTSTIKRCLNLMTHVITHKKYDNNVFYCKQITYLTVECPSDCSIKALVLNIFAAIDSAIGSNYFVDATIASRLSASALAIQAKIICLNHHVGILIIDEIQNAIASAYQSKQKVPLIKFLVELTNETYMSICFSGTTVAEELFLSQEHLKRRTRGLRLLPMKQDETFKMFLQKIWPYQMTRNNVKLTQEIEKVMYQYSAGIPSYIIKIFKEVQIEAIISGKEMITKELIIKVVKMQNIETPKLFKNGTSISSFLLEENDIQYCNEDNKTRLDGEIQTTRRGRKAIDRDSGDIIVMYKNSNNNSSFVECLKHENLLEYIRYGRS